MKKTLSAVVMGAVLLGFGANESFASTTYTVKSGDTLSEISYEHGTSVKNLKEWNDLTSDLIFPEQTLVLEEGNTTNSSSSTSAKQGSTYTVKSGDTLFKIATAHGTSVSNLQEWNNIQSHLIYPDQQLVVSANAVEKPSNSKQVAQKEEQKQTQTTNKETKNNNTAASEPKQQQQKQETKQNQTASNSKSESAKSTEQSTNSKPQQEAGKTMTVEATAYTAFCDGCSGTTSTGIDLRSNPNQKVIAVDPSVIPLGSKVHVEGYGTAVAGDIGGAIKGNRIDVFIPSKDEAYKWGRKQVKIQVLD